MTRHPITTARDLMSAEGFSVRFDDTVAGALERVRAAGVTAAPVVDDAGVAVGVVSVRALSASRGRQSVRTCMLAQAPKLRARDSLEAIAAIMAANRCRHLLVCDAVGKPLGTVFAVDVRRALHRRI